MVATLLNYTTITQDLSTVLASGATPNVTIYSDSNAENLFVDSNGATHSNKVIASVNYTEPHNNADNTQVKNGYLTVSFTDSTSVIVTDNVDTVYYTILSVPFQPRSF